GGRRARQAVRRAGDERRQQGQGNYRRPTRDAGPRIGWYGPRQRLVVRHRRAAGAVAGAPAADRTNRPAYRGPTQARVAPHAVLGTAAAAVAPAGSARRGIAGKFAGPIAGT